MAVTSINCTGDDVVHELEKMRAQWGYRTWKYNAPFLPALGKPSEYWCVDYWLEALRRRAGFDWRTFGVPTATMYLQPYFDRHWSKVSPSQCVAGDVGIMSRGGNEWSTYHFLVARGPMVNGVMDTEQGDSSSPLFPGSEYSGGAFVRKDLYGSYFTGNAPRRVRFWRPPYNGAASHTVSRVTPSNPYGWDTAHEQNLNAYLSSYDAKRFQTMLGVKADGVLGAQTVNALEKKFGRNPDGVLSAPSSNTLASMQRYLNTEVGKPWWHHPALVTDGQFGPATAAALHSYLDAKGVFTHAERF